MKRMRRVDLYSVWELRERFTDLPGLYLASGKRQIDQDNARTLPATCTEPEKKQEAFGKRQHMSIELQHSVAVMGLPLANVTEEEAIDEIEKLVLSGGTHQVATANLDFWLNSLHECTSAPDHCRMQSRVARWNAAGMDLAYARKALETAGFRCRPGSHAGGSIGPEGIQNTLFCSAGKPGVGARAAEVMQERFPGVNIVGHHAPPLADLERMDHGDTLERIRAAKPDILLVAFGNPKQEKWIRMHSQAAGRTGLDRHWRQHGHADWRCEARSSLDAALWL